MLLTIATTFGNVGARHVDDSWIKDKYVDSLMPYEGSVVEKQEIPPIE
jgi:hypothetical protein